MFPAILELSPLISRRGPDREIDWPAHVRNLDAHDMLVYRTRFHLRKPLRARQIMLRSICGTFHTRHSRE